MLESLPLPDSTSRSWSSVPETRSTRKSPYSRKKTCTGLARVSDVSCVGKILSLPLPDSTSRSWSSVPETRSPRKRPKQQKVNIYRASTRQWCVVCRKDIVSAFLPDSTFRYWSRVPETRSPRKSPYSRKKTYTGLACVRAGWCVVCKIGIVSALSPIPAPAIGRACPRRGPHGKGLTAGRKHIQG